MHHLIPLFKSYFTLRGPQTAQLFFASTMEPTAAAALARRRAQGRKSQKKYREMVKQREKLKNERYHELKQMNLNSAIYLALVEQGNLMRPHRYGQFRCLTMELYADYFKFGADPKEKENLMKQDRFLSFSFAPESNDRYELVLEQWIKMTRLFDHVMFKKVSVECAHPEQDVFLLTQIATLTISHRSIAALFPHMLNDQGFMLKVMGKQFECKTFHRATFDSNNRIVSLQREYGCVQGWHKILNDPKLVARVLSVTNSINNEEI